MNDMKDLITTYFKNGFSYKEILSVLKASHGITISLRSLHRLLRQQGMRRKSIQVNTNLVVKTVAKELRGSSSVLGYRAMHQKLVSQGITVDRDTVRLCLQSLDPEGVAARKEHRLVRRKYIAKGPNYLWHIDGNDKLKPFGFGIHGCIDGYSRKMLWLELSSSNKDPAVIAGYFLDSIEAIGGAPRAIRADRGTGKYYYLWHTEIFTRCIC